MHNSLSNKLTRYTAAMAAISAAGAASAQMVYTDVNPDSTMTLVNPIYQLDMDGDLNMDFTIYQAIYSSGSFSVYYNMMGAYTSASNYVNIMNVPILSTSTIAAVIPHAAGVFLTSSVSWGGYAIVAWDGTAYSMSTSGGALGQDFYAGVAFDISGNYHLGWVHLAVASDASTITIRDYAYSAQPAPQGVYTGDAVSVMENSTLNATIINMHNGVQVEFGELEGDKHIQLVNMMGQVVGKESTAAGNVFINTEALHTGAYVLHIQHESGSSAEKIYIR